MNSLLYAELLGMHAGDGTLYKTNSGGIVWELRGNLDEKEFYDTHISSLLQKLNMTFSTGIRSGGKNGCYGIRSTNKKLIKYLLNAGFPIGKKSTTVSIPEHILKGKLINKNAFLRGLFSADGTAYMISTNKSIIAKYPIIELSSASKQLRDESKNIINDNHIRSYTWTYNSKKDKNPIYFIRICGKKQCNAFQEKIGLINPKHFHRLYSNV